MHCAAAIAFATIAAVAGAQDVSAPPIVPASTSLTGELGAVSASGNSNFTTVSLGDRLVRTTGKWTLTETGKYVQGTVNHAQTANEFHLGGRADYAMTHRSTVFASVEDERNTFAGFRARVNEALGLAWKELEAANDTVTVDAGAEYTEELDDDRTRTRYPAGLAAATWKHAFSTSAYFLQTAEFQPDLRPHSGRRINSESAVVAPLSKKVALKVNYQIRYESRPPAGYGTTDRLLTTGIQLTF